MERENSPIIDLISFLAIAGNILFVLWILYNGIKEHFQGTVIEKISYITLMALLAVNAFLLSRRGRKTS